MTIWSHYCSLLSPVTTVSVRHAILRGSGFNRWLFLGSCCLSVGLQPVWPLTSTGHSPPHSCCSQKGNPYLLPFPDLRGREGASHGLGRRYTISRAGSSIQHTVSVRATSSTTLIYLSLSCCDHSPAAKPEWCSSGHWPPVLPNLLERQEHLRITATAQQ